MELRYWIPEPKWNLPTIDIESLEILAYIKFIEANVKLSPTLKSFFSSQDRVLPCLKTSSRESLSQKEEIFQELRMKYFDADNWLNEEQKMKLFSIKTLIQEKLIPAVESLLWLDSQNFTELTRGLYAKRCCYPSNFFYPQTMREALERNIMKKNSFLEEENNMVPTKLYVDAIEVINLLNEYLCIQKDYFFGDRVCSLDALLFSCLAILQKAPLLSCKLQNHFKTKVRLTQYVDKILSAYFKDSKIIGDEFKKIPSSSVAEDEDDKFDWVLPVSVATIAMVSYAINIGLFQLTK